MTYSFVTQEPRDIPHTGLMCRAITHHPFVALKQNPGGHTFKDDRELETSDIFADNT